MAIGYTNRPFNFLYTASCKHKLMSEFIKLHFYNLMLRILDLSELRFLNMLKNQILILDINIPKKEILQKYHVKI